MVLVKTCLTIHKILIVRYIYCPKMISKLSVNRPILKNFPDSIPTENCKHKVIYDYLYRAINYHQPVINCCWHQLYLLRRTSFSLNYIIINCTTNGSQDKTILISKTNSTTKGFSSEPTKDNFISQSRQNTTKVVMNK